MKLTKKRTVNIQSKDVVYKTDNNLIVTEHFVNGKQSGIDVKYGGNMKDVQVVFLSKAAFSKEAMKKYAGYPDWVSKHMKFVKTLKDLEKYIPYLSCMGGNILFDINEKPVSLPLIFDYIGSLEEKRSNDENYAELISLLKKHPYIMRLEEYEIPYYNRGFHGQKGISFAVTYIPQKEYEKLYKHCQKENWSVRMGDIMKLSFFGCNYGLYGKKITELLVKHHATEEQREEVDDSEDL